MKSKRFAIIGIAITLLILGTIVLVAITNRQNGPPATTPLTTSGSLTCLQHKNVAPGQPQTLECAIGIKTDDGRFYALQDLPQDASATPFTKHVTINGNVAPPEANGIYNTQGTIKVTSFTVN